MSWMMIEGEELARLKRRINETTGWKTNCLYAGRARVSALALALVTANSTWASDNDRTGSRFELWLHAKVNALSVRGYCCGVVSCFSTRLPSTRISAAERSMAIEHMGRPEE